MNPTTSDPVIPPPPQPPQPHRSSFSCDRHPDEKFSGFCPSCLCERLTTLDQSNNNNPSSSSRRNSTSSTSAAAAAIKSLFSKPSMNLPPKPAKPSSSFFPELRRSKSFSASKNDAIGINFEPQRKSCDVRNTLSSLFIMEKGDPQTHLPHLVSKEEVEGEGGGGGIESEEEEEEEEFEECEKVEINVEDIIVPEVQVQQARISCSEIVEEEEGEGEEEEEVEVMVSHSSSSLKQIKDFIDVDSQIKKSSGSGMKFWSAASVFSKKWHDWRRKQKLKKQNNGENEESGRLPVEKPLSRQFRETQSEVADYGYGRRSCDVDPRFSLDAGRISFDDARYSFEEPRASWDGYLMGRSFPKMHPMVSLVEDAPVVLVPRIDAQIPVEESPEMVNCMVEDESVPGGTSQTRDYYADSSSRRRKSLDRCSSTRKTAASVVAELDEMRAASNADSSSRTRKSLDRCSSTRRTAASVVAELDEMRATSNADSFSRTRKSLDRCSSTRKAAASVVAELDEMKGASNAKVSPATADCYHGAKVLVGERILRDSNSNSLRDDYSETFELGSLRDNASVIGNGEQKGVKKSRKWSWKLWGFMQRRNGGNKDEDDERYSGRSNGVARSLSESWQEFRRDVNAEPRGSLNRNVFRSNSSVSWRNSANIGGPSGNGKKSAFEINGPGKKKKDEFVLERNRSARYSPNHIDNGLLRFYLTPMRSSRRGAPGNNRLNGSHSIARSVLRLY